MIADLIRNNLDPAPIIWYLRESKSDVDLKNLQIMLKSKKKTFKELEKRSKYRIHNPCTLVFKFVLYRYCLWQFYKQANGRIRQINLDPDLQWNICLVDPLGTRVKLLPTKPASRMIDWLSIVVDWWINYLLFWGCCFID